jgi:predicted enzyme related to lactoylglutathione lyase
VPLVVDASAHLTSLTSALSLGLIGASGDIVGLVSDPSLSLIEFPADDPVRARHFWGELLGVALDERMATEGRGWQTHSQTPAVGVHERGRGPGDSFSLPYFVVADIAETVERVTQLGGSVVHPGDAWAICKDTEGSPFGLARQQITP